MPRPSGPIGDRAFVLVATLVAGGALVVTALSGCRIWRDYGGNFTSAGDSRDVRDSTLDVRPDGGGSDSDPGACPPNSERQTTVDLGAGSATESGTICPGDTHWFVLELTAGRSLSVSATYPTGRALLSVELFDERPSGGEVRPLERPVWDENGVGLEELVTRSGEYSVRLHYPAGSAGGSVDYELAVETGERAERVRWLEAAASGTGDGSRANPWTRWSEALSSLEPGDMLVTSPGRWTETGECRAGPGRCVEIDEFPGVDCRDGHADGTARRPIVVAAERERQSILVGDGRDAAFSMHECRHWEVHGLAMRSSENSGERGGNGVLLKGVSDVLVRRLLISRPNPARINAGLLVNGGSDVRIVETEVYGFHDRGVVVSHSSGVSIERSYLNARGAGESGDESRGLSSFRSEHLTVADTIVEQANTGYEIIAPGSGGVPEIDVGDHHVFAGAVARDVDTGFTLTPRQNQCNSASEPDCHVSDTLIRDSVVLEADEGIEIRAGRNNRVESSSSFRASTTGFALAQGPVNSDDGNRPPSERLAIARSLASGAGQTGFAVDEGLEEWSLASVNAHGMDRPYETPETPQSAHQIAPELGGCRVHIPETSPLHDVDGETIGADMVTRHVGESRSDVDLWDQRNGRFPCGRVVDGRVNDSTGRSCADVHERLAVGTDGCPIP